MAFRPGRLSANRPPTVAPVTTSMWSANPPPSLLMNRIRLPLLPGKENAVEAIPAARGRLHQVDADGISAGGPTAQDVCPPR
jgi:hypothetical protein